MKPYSILVTGADGFIGRHLAAWYSGRARIHTVGRGVRLAEWFAALEPRPDAAIHAAGPASIAASFRDPARDLHDSVDSLIALLEAVRHSAPHCRVLFLSSAAVYGNPALLPVTEDAPLAPISPYGYHKVLCEQIISEYRTLYNLDIRIARIFSAYGPGLARQLFWELSEKIRHALPIALSGSGAETRDFLFIDDLVRALDMVLSSPSTGPYLFNVASGASVTIRHAALTLLRAFEFSLHLPVGSLELALEFNHLPRRGDPLHWAADIERLRQLGFVSQVRLDEGLAAFVRWHLQVYPIPVLARVS